MLRSYPCDALGADQLERAKWIDLLSPTEAEIAAVSARLGFDIPTRRSLEKIEASSRLNAKAERLTMSAPLLSGTATDHWQVAPVGFILSPSTLVTIRFADLDSFDQVSRELRPGADIDPAKVFTHLLEAVVDRAADHMERASEAINETSQTIFFDKPKRKRVSHDTATLHHAMRRIGQVSDRIARVRYAFLSVGRMADFALERCAQIDGGVRERLEAVRSDIDSLEEFETSLSNRIQLLQDSAVGFISIEQNDVVKVLTVVSVVGVPPVLVVGVYGMNFRYMPELGWHLGYPYALLLCLLSIVAPLLWFKWRDWI